MPNRASSWSALMGEVSDSLIFASTTSPTNKFETLMHQCWNDLVNEQEATPAESKADEVRAVQKTLNADVDRIVKEAGQDLKSKLFKKEDE